MAIRKELKLIASLDSKELKRQLKTLRESISSEFSSELGSVRRAVTTAQSKPVTNQRINEEARLKKVVHKTNQDAITDLSKQDWTSFQKNLKAKQKAAKDESAAAKKLIKDKGVLEKDAHNKIIDQIKAEYEVRSRADTNFRKFQASKRREEMTSMRNLPGMLNEFTSQSGLAGRAGGLGSRFARGGKASMGAAGGLGVAGIGALATLQQVAGFRVQSLLDVAEGRVVEDIARQAGRGGGGILPTTGKGAVGGIAGALAGAGTAGAAGAALGSMVGPVGTAAGGIIGGIGGGIAGYFGGRKLAGELEVTKSRPLQQAFQRAQGLAPAQMGAMRGGGIRGQGIAGLLGQSDMLSALQAGGTAEGFTPEQTVQQFTQARGSLGNIGATGTINQMQRELNISGTSIGTQAQGTELFTGAGQQNVGASAAFSTMQQTLTKAVAAGLDVSKSGKFLQATVGYIQQNIGLGRMNLSRQDTRMGQLTRGFAGGGEASTLDIMRARETMQRQRLESTSTSGFSGIGNVLAAQEAGLTDPMQFMAALNISADASAEDVMGILGVDRNQAEQFLQAKSQTLNKGMNAAGLGRTGKVALGSRETGVTAEQFRGRMGGEAGAAGSLDIAGAEQTREESEAGFKATPQFGLARTRARFAQAQVSVATDTEIFAIAIGRVAKSTGDLATALEENVRKIAESARSLGISMAKE